MVKGQNHNFLENWNYVETAKIFIQRFLQSLRGTSSDRHRPLESRYGPAHTALDWCRSKQVRAGLNRSVPVPLRDRKKRYTITVNKNI